MTTAHAAFLDLTQAYPRTVPEHFLNRNVLDDQYVDSVLEEAPATDTAHSIYEGCQFRVTVTRARALHTGFLQVSELLGFIWMRMQS